MNSPRDLPIFSKTRPFSTDALTGTAMPDGIFDTALLYQDVNVFITNSSNERLNDLTFVFDDVVSSDAIEVASLFRTPNRLQLSGDSAS